MNLKLAGLFLSLFINGVMAAVDSKVSEGVNAVSPLLTNDIPVLNSSGDEPGVLKQLSLKVQSREKDKMDIWKKVRLCETCHAGNMVNQNGYLPVLQGQNLQYLYSKLLQFKNNRRSHHPLQSYLESLTDDGLMDISNFYSRQDSPLQQVLVLDDFQFVDQRNRLVTLRECAECHGVDGNGDQLVPAISGQNKKYLSYRIREIADNTSRVHLSSNAPVSCNLKDVDIRRSRQLASLLSVVIDKNRVEQGAEVFRQKCAECHSVEDKTVQAVATPSNWSRHLLSGTQPLVNRALSAYQHKFTQRRYLSIGQNEMKNAIHYMVRQLMVSQ